MTIASTVSAVATALETVSGLRVQTAAGKANPPAAVVELDRVQTPSAFGSGTSDYIVRVALLVQPGEFRDSIDRTYALADNAIAALLAAGSIGGLAVEMGTLEYGGQHYAGCVVSVAVIE